MPGVIGCTRLFEGSLVVAAVCCATTAAASPDLSTPRRAAFGFIDACRAGDYVGAAEYLSLGHIPAGERVDRGPRLARRLKLVLDRQLWIDRDAVSDAPEGDLEDDLPPDQDRLGYVTLGGGRQGIRLAYSGGEEPGWRFSANTVRAIDDLYREHGLGLLGERMPDGLRLRIWEFELWQLLGLIGLVPLAYATGRVAGPLAARAAGAAASRTRSEWDDQLAAEARRPIRILLTAVLVGLAAETLSLAVPARELVMIAVRTAALVALGLLARSSVTVLGTALEQRLASASDDPTRQRSIATQVGVLRRVVLGAVVMVVAALVLAQFQVMRTVGLSLLASAGVAGLAVTFAAQRSIAGLFAGLQILITQPIRIGDIVIVEGEWGTIEEINFTHVVVKIWDLRRLVVPIGYFLETPFQNWTRASPELLGTIYFYADHSVDVDAMRQELDRILSETDLWDGKVKGVIVSGIKDHVVEVRALISAADADRQWQLRCLVREKLLGWLQRQGTSLPTVRIDAPRGIPAGPP
jgi:small-conductance mechanosensitive channel